MKNKNSISVIIPVHELDEITTQTFGKAIESIIIQLERPEEVVVVVPKGSLALSFMKSFDFGEIKNIVVIAENDGLTDFSSQVNFGVEYSKMDWISVLEYDDEYSNIWFKNVVKYRDAYKNTELFLPIVVDVDNTGAFNGFTNEAVWANEFSEQLGVLDTDALLAYQNFNIDGMVIKKSVYQDFGGFKPSVKLTFITEFLLRMTFKDVKVMVIPKFGYKHINLREGGLFSTYKQTMDPNEVKWWLNVAKKEYFFDKDRELTYDKQL